MNPDFALLPGTPETALRPDELASLPGFAAPAPWRVVARTLFWSARPDATARAAIREVVPAELLEGAVPIITIGGLLSYQETPVGEYSEVIGIVVFRRGRSVFAHVPFIAVDSPASVVGGRTNWALPKTLARFTGRPGEPGGMVAAGETWRVRAEASPGRVPLPLITPHLPPVVQIGPGGRRFAVRPRGHGTMRPVRVEVSVAGRPSLRDWLPSGRRIGVLGTPLTASLGPAT